MIKDAADLVPLLCGHYVRIGFDRLIFVDDGSTDGTFDTLCAISRSDPKVSVRRAEAGPSRQAVLMTEAANQVIAEGYPIVFPFDSDEFWNVDAQQVRVAANGVQSGVFVGRWVNFVQSRRRLHPGRRALLRITHRAPMLPGTNLETVESWRSSFVCVSEPKVGFKANGPVQIMRGQHSLLAGPANVLGSDLEVFHLPLRSIAEIDRRAHRAARLLENAQPGESWQSRFFHDAVAAGKRGDIWKANSAGDDGCLDIGGNSVMLIPDTRLRSLLMRAWLYTALRHPWLAMRS